MPSDPYQILQVPRQANPDQIRAAYLRLVLAHHPDLNPGDALAAERFKQVQRAYEQIVQRFPAGDRNSFGAALDPPFVRAHLASHYAARSRRMAQPAWDARSFSAGALAAVAILVALTGSVLWTERGSQLWEKSIRRLLATVRTTEEETAPPPAVADAESDAPSAPSAMPSEDAHQDSLAARDADPHFRAETIAAPDSSADEAASTPESPEAQAVVSADDRTIEQAENVVPVADANALRATPFATPPDATALAPESPGPDAEAERTFAQPLSPPTPSLPDHAQTPRVPVPMSTSNPVVENSGPQPATAPLAAIDLWTLDRRPTPGPAAATESVAGEPRESAPTLSGRTPSPWSKFSELGPGRPIPQPLPTMPLLNPAGASPTGAARGGNLVAQPLGSPLGSLSRAPTGAGPLALGRLTPDVTNPLPNWKSAGPTSPGAPSATTSVNGPLSKPRPSASAGVAPGAAWRSPAAGGFSVLGGNPPVGGAAQGAVMGQGASPTLPQWANPPWKTPARAAPGGTSSIEFDRQGRTGQPAQATP